MRCLPCAAACISSALLFVSSSCRRGLGPATTSSKRRSTASSILCRCSVQLCIVQEQVPSLLSAFLKNCFSVMSVQCAILHDLIVAFDLVSL
ncbi:hypothetical protein GUJ93_ZPchr0254g2864 [Zizania palustris]|uniref:Secreted protein n=1 Tax=Zizania palustris TaxID=103762 RepID=A0A8J5UV41_ZIZPA|nr:hypothetical protein GUJ93_ZPchr0254g2864 [Zizania palustris]